MFTLASKHNVFTFSHSFCTFVFVIVCLLPQALGGHAHVQRLLLPRLHALLLLPAHVPAPLASDRRYGHLPVFHLLVAIDMLFEADNTLILRLYVIRLKKLLIIDFIRKCKIGRRKLDLSRTPTLLTKIDRLGI